MSYANGTTHYNLPQTVGTDKRDWFDTNQAFADIDAALYGAVEQSTSTATALTALTTRVGTAESNIATIQASQSTDEANIAALQTLTSQHTTQIADVRADALDMICAVDEGTAQVATVAVEEGKYFRYNDVLYMATTNIAVGDTIVPNTNCRATNVATELEAIETVDIYPYDVVATGTGTTFTEKLQSLATAFGALTQAKKNRACLVVSGGDYDGCILRNNSINGIFVTCKYVLSSGAYVMLHLICDLGGNAVNMSGVTPYAYGSVTDVNITLALI